MRNLYIYVLRRHNFLRYLFGHAQFINFKVWLWDHTFSTYAKFSEKKLTFLTTWYAHVSLPYQGVRNVSFSKISSTYYMDDAYSICVISFEIERQKNSYGHILDNVFKIGPSENCERRSLKNLMWYGWPNQILLGPSLNALPHISWRSEFFCWVAY